MWPFKALFGSPETTGKVVDAAVKGMDAIIFTDEEKSLAGEKFRDWYLKYLEATHPQNLSRRLITIFVMILWTALMLLGVLVWPVSPEYSDIVFKYMNEVVSEPFAWIVGFYFGTHAIRAAVGAFKKPGN